MISTVAARIRHIATSPSNLLSAGAGLAAVQAQIQARRIDFDMGPVTTAVAVFCGVLALATIAGAVVLGIKRERKKRDAMYESQWQEDITPGASEDEAEPFVAHENGEPDVSASVEEMFDTEYEDEDADEEGAENKKPVAEGAAS